MISVFLLGHHSWRGIHFINILKHCLDLWVCFQAGREAYEVSGISLICFVKDQANFVINRGAGSGRQAAPVISGLLAQNRQGNGGDTQVRRRDKLLTICRLES